MDGIKKTDNSTKDINISYISGLVSVIIPTYKRSNTLIRAIDSVLNQTYSSIECIVVNDNEKNDAYSLELYKELHSYTTDNRFVFLEQDKHINGAAARNAGIRKSKGEYIAFLDDDDWWREDKIERQIEFIKKQDDHCGVVSTLAIYYKGDKVVRKTKQCKNGYVYKEILSREYDNVTTCSLMIKHNVIDEICLFDENLKRHQETQLLGNITYRYTLMVLPEYLTYISVDDVTNRPKSEDFIKYKKDFIKSIDPILNSLKKSEKKCIIYLHKIEIINAYRKEKRYSKMLLEIFKILSCPCAFYKAIKRGIWRYREGKV